MSVPGPPGDPPSNVSALIDALDERARRAGSEGATTVLRGILGSVAEVLNGIELRLGHIEDRMRDAGTDDRAVAVGEQMQAGLNALNSRLGRLEEAFVKAVEDSGSGTDAVIEQLGRVVEAAVRDQQATTPSLPAPAPPEVTEGLAEVRDHLQELSAQLGQLAVVRAEVRTLGNRLDELADVRAELEGLTDLRQQLSHLVQVASKLDELSLLPPQPPETSDLRTEMARIADQLGDLGDRAGMPADGGQSSQIAEVRADVDQLAAELVAQFADVRDRLADVAATVSDLGASLDSESVPATSPEPATTPALEALPDTVGELVAEVRELAAAVDDLREELTQQEERRRQEPVPVDRDTEASSSTLEATAMLTGQVSDLSAAVRAQNEAIAELRAVAGSLRDLPAAVAPAESDAALRASVDALRADVTAALHRTETTLVESVAAPRPRRRLLPLLALLIALGSIGFSLLPFTAAGGVECDPPLLVANPDIRETARYPDPDPACEPVGNTRLIGSAAVAFLAVVIGAYGAAFPARRNTRRQRRRAHSPPRS